MWCCCAPCSHAPRQRSCRDSTSARSSQLQSHQASQKAWLAATPATAAPQGSGRWQASSGHERFLTFALHQSLPACLRRPSPSAVSLVPGVPFASPQPAPLHRHFVCPQLLALHTRLSHIFHTSIPAPCCFVQPLKATPCWSLPSSMPSYQNLSGCSAPWTAAAVPSCHPQRPLGAPGGPTARHRSNRCPHQRCTARILHITHGRHSSRPARAGGSHSASLHPVGEQLHRLAVLDADRYTSSHACIARPLLPHTSR
jgi:hypothetical protein